LNTSQVYSGRVAGFVIQLTENRALVDLLHLSQSCSDISTLIYTVSENAGALYERYSKAEEQLAVEGVETAEKCAETLKKSCAPLKPLH